MDRLNYSTGKRNKLHAERQGHPGIGALTNEWALLIRGRLDSGRFRSRDLSLLDWSRLTISPIVLMSEAKQNRPVRVLANRLATKGGTSHD